MQRSEEFADSFKTPPMAVLEEFWLGAGKILVSLEFWLDLSCLTHKVYSTEIISIACKAFEVIERDMTLKNDILV